MLQLAGEHIESLPFEGLKKQRDLLEFEGPLLSHFKDALGNDILFYWVDYDSEHNRWLVFQVDGRQLDGYLSKNKSLHEIITNPVFDFFYTVDIDKMVGFKNVVKIYKTELDEKYLPGKDSFYS